MEFRIKSDITASGKSRNIIQYRFSGGVWGTWDHTSYDSLREALDEAQRIKDDMKKSIVVETTYTEV